LGSFGIGDYSKALEFFDEILKKDAMHFGAKSHIKMADQKYGI